MSQEKQYIGTYKVVKIFRVSAKRKVLRSGLTREDAIKVVNSYPDSNRHIVVFEKQFYSKKHFI